MTTIELAAAAHDVQTAPVTSTLDHRAAVHRRGQIAVFVFRVLGVAPIATMVPEFIAAALGRPNGLAHLVTSSNDVLGVAALVLFVLMLAVTPVQTITGWSWHRVLRRDFGRMMFGYAGLDLVIAATLTASRFPGGLMSRVGGHGFLLSGTLSTFLVVPLMATSNRAAQRWLGKNWKVLHRLVYFTWATILIHLAFLFALRSFFIDMLVVSAPLAFCRIGRVERNWSALRKERRRPIGRAILTVVVFAVFALGLEPFVVELIHVGAGAFSQRPQ